MKPGDTVICTDATNHCWTLRVGESYIVDTVRQSDGWISIVGMARMWPPTQFTPSGIAQSL